MKKYFLTLLFVVMTLNALLAQSNIKETVYFESGKFELTQSSKNKLDQITKRINVSEIEPIKIIGYTDYDGDDEFNEELSKKRAIAVFEYFNAKGVKNIETEYFGEKQPVASNEKEQGKQLNRRVEVIYTYTPKVVIDIFPKFEKETQQFSYDATKTIEIKGKEGTSINIPANSLVKKNGEKVTGEVKISLSEYYLKSDIVLANLHTMSDQGILETGGMIYIEVTKNGEKLELSKGNEMTINFKSGPDTAGMEIFQGVTKDNQFNWVQNISYSVGVKIRKRDYTSTQYAVLSDGIISIADTAEYRKQSMIEGVILESANLGWINCDRFYKFENKTNLIVNVDTSYKPNIRLVFKDINSIMPGWRKKGDNRIYFESIPVGKSATLIGFSMVNDQVYFASKEITIGKNQQENIELLQTTLAALENDLKKLD